MSLLDARAAITRAHHAEWARVVASLAKRFGDLDIAEEAAAEAFATAVERWPNEGYLATGPDTDPVRHDRLPWRMARSRGCVARAKNPTSAPGIA